MTVYLVGAGPGEPELLTVRALRLLRQADLVVHDRLVDERTLALARPGAELVDVGKEPFAGGADQDSITALLIARGRGELVVRLKGGDPYVFGRGGEEALALRAAGVDYEVVPGISAVIAVPALAGVPLTMRQVTSTVVVVTGHDPDGATSAPIDWEALGASDATLVVVMAVAQRAEIAKRLIAAGRPGSTPTLVVERGATPEQVSHRTTLEELGALTVRSPSTIVVGAVAALDLASIEDRPLHGVRVALTRPEQDASALADLLAADGARIVAVPTIEIVPLPDGAREAAGSLSGPAVPDWVVCTSAHGVEVLFSGLRDARALAGARIGAVGPATAARFRHYGVLADLVAEPASVAGLLAAFPASGRGERVLYPRAAAASGELAAGLRARGYLVEDPPVYETRPRHLDAAARAELRRSGVIVLASPSALAGLVEALSVAEIDAALVSIGPTTSAAIRDVGLAVAAEAATASPEGLIEAVRSLRVPGGGTASLGA